ncbi:unnamed protein product, partial [Meganyctiphanes norvegica]
QSRCRSRLARCSRRGCDRRRSSRWTNATTIMVTKIVIVALGLLFCVNGTFGLSCRPCHKVDCGPPPSCSYDVIKSICGCCYTCAKGPGDKCGGPWGASGECTQGLTCQLDHTHPGNDFNKDGICVGNVPQGIVFPGTYRRLRGIRPRRAVAAAP